MRMVAKAALEEMRLRTCAIGVLKVSVAEYVKEPRAPLFKIFGTGFLVAPLTVMTNRHVVASISTFIERESISKDRRYVAFLRPDGEGVANTFHEIEKTGMATGPRTFDVGLVSFRAADDDPIRQTSSVRLNAQFCGDVGDAISVYGYAAGENLLKREFEEKELIYRFGPILQHGYISGIAPYEHASHVDRLLLDVRTSRGMSGSPIFDPQSGTVLAIHDAGVGDTVAFGIPLSSEVMSQLLSIHASGSPGERGEGMVSYVGRLDSSSNGNDA
jgi:hypothetical protein